ncbi:TetR/AcrR family transcriptional regulator [Enterovirga aerilata]|uniref:Helix-turn-helix transcriptional regulator n=1 Tax=Enterovirga aerilata TaxID=2730920 RepID=A0A849ICA6_9HYPH|nr:helix-turn-helix domain-containing protein [Enterovirga sp. DB1703]NNM73607.1 helix-turn-helix transcriptional regulator [Enterovirga sp. DB1703]
MHAVGEERWREERRGRIPEAAGRVFAARCFDPASMDGTAQEARVGKPTLYRYVPSKDPLFSAVFGEVLNELETRLVALVREVTDVILHGPVARDMHRHAAPCVGHATLDADRRNGELRLLPGASA